MIADTHLPRGDRRLPIRCLELIAAADALIHAGDLVSEGVLRELQEIGPPVHAVHGNVDEPALRRSLPAEVELELNGRRVAVVHDAGPRRNRLERLRRRYPEAEAVIFGHNHIPLLEGGPQFQIFNPGSPTDRRRAPTRSMGLMEVAGHGLRFEHVPLT